MKQHQSGFTLVEIAIVLVIIGLLLGGILKGQELISSAKVRNLADQGSAVKAAFFAFQDRYRAVPGDYAQALANLPAGAGTVLNGSGNGQIGTPGAVANQEHGQAWLQLGRAGFLSGSFDGAAAANNLTCPATTCPSNAFNGRMTLFFGSIANGTGAATTHEIRTGSQIPVGIIAELDRKVDDGMPNTGSFQFDGVSTAACLTPTGTAPTSAWNVAAAAPQSNCAGVYLM